MAIQSKPVINPQTATATAGFFLERTDLPARLSANGLAGSETVTISCVDGPAGSQVTTPVYIDGVAATLTPTAPSFSINAPGQFSVTKSVTAAVAGVFLAKG